MWSVIKFKTYTDSMSSIVMQVGQKLKAWGISHTWTQSSSRALGRIVLCTRFNFCWIEGDISHIQLKFNQQNFMSKPELSGVWKIKKGPGDSKSFGFKISNSLARHNSLHYCMDISNQACGCLFACLRRGR